MSLNFFTVAPKNESKGHIKTDITCSIFLSSLRRDLKNSRNPIEIIFGDTKDGDDLVYFTEFIEAANIKRRTDSERPRQLIPEKEKQINQSQYSGGYKL